MSANPNQGLRDETATSRVPLLAAASLHALKNREYDLARKLAQEATELAPNHASSHAILGDVFRAQGQLPEAVVCYEKATALAPGTLHYRLRLAGVYSALGRHEAAIQNCRAAIENAPGTAAGHTALGNAFHACGRERDAIIAYREALKWDPKAADAVCNLGTALLAGARFGDAVATYQRARELLPNSAAVLNNLAGALRGQGRISEAIALWRLALELDPGLSQGYSNLVFAMNYDARESPESLFRAHCGWGKRYAARLAPPEENYANSRDPRRRLRVGYVSPDFRNHSVAFFCEPLLLRHSPEDFEIFGYADVVVPDAVTKRLEGLVHHWRPIVGQTNLAVTNLVRSDGIDILVDLTGHSANHRLLVFARKPAPIQVSWLGYPNTTGVSTIDYRLTDAEADPRGEADGWHTEVLVRLPQGFLCYLPPSDAPDVSALRALSQGHVTFGSFNTLVKVTPETVGVWSQILERVPGSRLLLKGEQFHDPPTRRLYFERFGAQGIGPERLELVSWIPGQREHLAAYGQVDIGLDPFPYNGTTTTCEALWMGVPVVTLLGNRHASRVGASLLTRVGLTGLIARSGEDYVDQAVHLATDIARLTELRKTLREQVRSSPLCDAPGFARRVEGAYRTMWRLLCEGKSARTWPANS